MAERPRVSIGRCDSYEPRGVGEALRECLKPLGGMGAFVRPGQRVLLKPNFVAARPAGEACNTHPEFILAVARLVREAGGEPAVGDSPAMGTLEAVARRMGLFEPLRAEGIPLVEFRVGDRARSGLGDCSVTIAREVVEADVLINLPKLKTHQQVGMTCCVKNLFGCVAGRRKALLHLLRGGDEDRFGGMLLDVARMARPALHIVDGITAMHRGGPIWGEPLDAGLLLAGVDPVAVDTVAFHLAGVDAESVCTHRAARRAGAGACEMAAIDLRGVPIGELRVPRFEAPPLMMPLNFSPWHIAIGWVRHQWLGFRSRGG